MNTFEDTLSLILEKIGIAVAIVLLVVFVIVPGMIWDFWFGTYQKESYGYGRYY